MFAFGPFERGKEGISDFSVLFHDYGASGLMRLLPVSFVYLILCGNFGSATMHAQLAEIQNVLRTTT